jgi:hypothetical protein
MNCKKIFDEGALPRIEDLIGVFRVSLVGRFLPSLCVCGHRKVFLPGAHSGPTGHNRFLGFIKIAYFEADIGESLIVPGEMVLRIMYRNHKNAFFIRALTDEVRQTAPGEYIGRGVYDICGKRFRIFYFTISKMDR